MFKKRKKKSSLGTTLIKDSLIESLAKSLTRQIDREAFEKKYARVGDILKLVGAGLFLTASIVVPNLPRALKPFLANEDEYHAWKRFNIPYLKRTLLRLEKQKLIEINEEKGVEVIKITSDGKKRILKFAIEEVAIKKPKFWDGKWRLISYDIPGNLKAVRNILREYLRAWGFYPLHESVFLHAYSCEREVEFLREYLGVGDYVRIFQVSRIENDKVFREFFGI